MGIILPLRSHFRTDNGHFTGGNAQTPSINKKYAVVHKDYVADYTKPYNKVLMEYESGADGLTYRYTYGLDSTSGMQKNNVVIYGISNGVGSTEQSYHGESVVKLYYHQDRLGSSDYLTSNVDGKVTSYVSYDDWGAPTMKPILQVGVRQLDLVTEYTGYTYDAVLGAYYAQARIYDATNRRFMAVDPIKGTVGEPQTMVQYTYVLNNPLRYVDPTGLVVTDRDKASHSTEELKQLEANTNAWNEAKAAGDEKGMAAAAASSRAIREATYTGTERQLDDGTTVGEPASKKPEEPDLSSLTSDETEFYNDVVDYVSEYINSSSTDDLMSWAESTGDSSYVAMVMAIIDAEKAGNLHEKIDAMNLLAQWSTFEMARSIVTGIAQQATQNGFYDLGGSSPLDELNNLLDNQNNIHSYKSKDDITRYSMRDIFENLTNGKISYNTKTKQVEASVSHGNSKLIVSYDINDVTRGWFNIAKESTITGNVQIYENGQEIESSSDNTIDILYKTKNTYVKLSDLIAHFEKVFVEETISQNELAMNLTVDYMNNQYNQLANLPQAIDSETTAALVRQFSALQFDSPEEAAFAFAMVFHELSIAQKQEYGAVIYELGGSYKMTVKNSARTAGPNYEYDGSDLPEYKEGDASTGHQRNHVVIPDNRNEVAHIHTHWAPDGNLSFSNPSDYNHTNNTGNDAYLVNRNGEILITQSNGSGGNTGAKLLWTLP